ncbi:MAG TPA: YggT family protein [Candidatus Baltobacteraceae bacterium]|nr:YggT family protein [Candidatus Baltobacteraceae bacterium]
MCQLDQLIVWVFRAYSVLLFVYAILSWIPDLRGPWVRYLAAVVEPVLAPIRRIIPPLGGLDMAFLVLIVLINFVIVPILQRAVYSACYF